MAPHYYIEYNYQRKSKHVLIDASYVENEKLRDAAKLLSTELNHVINDAYDRSIK